MGIKQKSPNFQIAFNRLISYFKAKKTCYMESRHFRHPNFMQRLLICFLLIFLGGMGLMQPAMAQMTDTHLELISWKSPQPAQCRKGVRHNDCNTNGVCIPGTYYHSFHFTPKTQQNIRLSSICIEGTHYLLRPNSTKKETPGLTIGGPDADYLLEPGDSSALCPPPSPGQVKKITIAYQLEDRHYTQTFEKAFPVFQHYPVY